MRPIHTTLASLGLAAGLTLALPLTSAVVPSGFGLSALAASFDCTRARSADERAICGNRVLEDRDVELSTLYGLIVKLVPMGTRDVIRREQSQWLSGRGQCGGDVPCIRRSYDRRIASLRSTIDQRVVSQGPF